MHFVRAQNCTFFPSLPLPFPTVIAFNRAKKSPLIIGIVDRIKINFCKQLFQFSESELSHTFCKLHVSTYFVCFVYFRGDRSDKSSLARGRRSSREKGNNQGVGNFRFINILKLFSIFFSITLLYLFIPILFLPTTFTHTHTHRPRPLPTTHDI